MLRYRSNTQKRDQPSWLVTYSDVITLCLTFFVLLYSFSTLDAIKWKRVVQSVQGALGPFENVGGLLQDDQLALSQTDYEEQEEIDAAELAQFMLYQEETKKLEQMQERLLSYLAELGMSNNVTVEIEERGLILRFQDSVLFNKGKADLLPQSQQVLKEIIAIFHETANPIRVEGHTDDLPINTPQFPSNWELSTTRATNVLRYLIQEGIPGKRLSAIGYGEFHPLVPNDGEENRKKNRRVDIVLLRESMKINEPQ